MKKKVPAYKETTETHLIHKEKNGAFCRDFI